MTRYWPFSFVAGSPLAPPAYANEIRAIHSRPPGRGAYLACVDICQQTEPLDTPNLAIIESTDSPWRRMYTSYPGWNEWVRLERGGFLQDDEGLIVGFWDALH